MATAIPKVLLKIDGASYVIQIKNDKAETIRIYPPSTYVTEAHFITFAKELAKILELPLKATRKVITTTTEIEVINV